MEKTIYLSRDYFDKVLGCGKQCKWEDSLRQAEEKQEEQDHFWGHLAIGCACGNKYLTGSRRCGSKEGFNGLVIETESEQQGHRH